MRTPRAYLNPPDDDGWDEYLHGPRATWMRRRLREEDEQAAIDAMDPDGWRYEDEDSQHIEGA